MVDHSEAGHRWVTGAGERASLAHSVPGLGLDNSHRVLQEGKLRQGAETCGNPGKRANRASTLGLVALAMPL